MRERVVYHIKCGGEIMHYYNISEDVEKNRKNAEALVLIILGMANGKLSMLHLQKIFFLLWKFHPGVKSLAEYLPHRKGPYSPDVDDIVKSPMHLTNCWEYLPPPKSSEAEKIKGGYAELTKEGWEIYHSMIKNIEEKAKKDDSILALLAAIELIVPIYSKMEWDELLFLIYTDSNNKEFTKKSELYNSIINNSENIVDRLIKKGIIPEEKRKALLSRAGV